MFNLKEDSVNPNATEVYYQDPEELRKDPEDVVVHDVDDIELHTQSYDPVRQALSKAKSDPKTVSIAKVDDKYYMNHDDLKVFMDACGETDYDCAVNHVIDAHSESCDINVDNVCVILNKDNISNLDEDAREMMEKSEVSFEFRA